MRRAGRLVVLCVAACALVIGTAGAAGNLAGTPRATVAFIGDSNLLLSGSALDLALSDRDHGEIVVNVARSGTSIRSREGVYWKARVAALQAAVDVDAFVIDLGINDTKAPGSWAGPGYHDYGKKIDWLLDQLDASVPVLWTNLPCRIEPTSRATGCAAVNRALDGARSRHRNLTVVDWARVARSHPSWISDVHYTPTGRTAYAKVVANALAKIH